MSDTEFETRFTHYTKDSTALCGAYWQSGTYKTDQVSCPKCRNVLNGGADWPEIVSQLTKSVERLTAMLEAK